MEPVGEDERGNCHENLRKRCENRPKCGGWDGSASRNLGKTTIIINLLEQKKTKKIYKNILKLRPLLALLESYIQLK